MIFLHCVFAQVPGQHREPVLHAGATDAIRWTSYFCSTSGQHNLLCNAGGKKSIWGQYSYLLTIFSEAIWIEESYFGGPILPLWSLTLPHRILNTLGNFGGRFSSRTLRSGWTLVGCCNFFDFRKHCLLNRKQIVQKNWLSITCGRSDVQANQKHGHPIDLLTLCHSVCPGDEKTQWQDMMILS